MALTYASIFLVDIIVPWLLWVMVGQGLWIFALLGALILVLFNVIFLMPKAFAYRYMFPGLLCFFLFMVLPIFFTVYIGFTNWGTGHMVSQQTAKELILAEKFLPEGANVYSYSLIPTEQGMGLQVKMGDTYYHGVILKDIVEFSKGELTPTGRPLDKKELYHFYDQHRDLTFYIDGTLYSFYGISKIAAMEHRYKEGIDGGIIDISSQKLFKPDEKDGFYHSGKEQLLPGYTINVGLNNFTKLFKDPKLSGPFFKIFSWTFLWAFMTVTLTFSLGMLLALILNRKTMKFRVFYRILLIIPYSIPFFISVLVFKGMLNKDFGAINEMLSMLFNIRIDWLNNGFWAKVSCLMVNLWLGFPYMLLLLTGILQSIPGDVYEAAEIDGASRWTQFTKITLPLVFSSIGPLLVGSFAFNFNNFVGIYLLTGGNPPMQGVMTPAGETDILISYTYRLAFEGGQGQDFGLASAMAILIFGVIAVLTLINFRMSGMIGGKKGKAA